jgi:superfamily I DNA and/or RNA helicase
VTPFRKVQDGLRDRLRREFPLLIGLTGERSAESHSKWIKGRVGTIHTVQGREADSVIVVLGAPLAAQAGARIWAGALQPNLLNVAVSRAKENLYVIGSRKAWGSVGYFKVLANALPISSKPTLHSHVKAGKSEQRSAASDSPS